MLKIDTGTCEWMKLLFANYSILTIYEINNNNNGHVLTHI